MKKILPTLLLLMLATNAFAAGDQAYLGIFAETSIQKMAGMPAMPALPPGMDASKIPGFANLMSMGAAKRSLNVRLWSPGIAAKDATATIAIPAALKLGDKLDLELYRPKAEKAEAGMPAGFDPAKMTIKRYWGSSETVKAGQPEVVKWGNLTPDQQRQMRDMSRKAQGSYFYKPDWTTGHWPTEGVPGDVAKDASLLGHYALTTNYTGNVAIDVPASVEFLGPIEMSSPKLEKRPPLDQFIKFQWKSIPGILGYHVMVVGMQGKDTVVIWTSSEISSDVGGQLDYLEMAEVAAYVKSTVMMKGDRTSVSVPAGIFKDCDVVMFTMTGYGPGAAGADSQPLPRVQTKTTLNIMLGGKKMSPRVMGEPGDESPGPGTE